jgi:uncharacterized membrane protein YgcG
MKYKILLYGFLAATIAGCSSAYKATQTPDDVYYSPVKEGVEKSSAKSDKYEDYTSSQDDQYLRMKVRNRQRWSGLDDYSYWNDSRYFPYYNNFDYNYFSSGFYSPFAWNNWNSPYFNFYYNPFYAGINSYFPYYGYGYGGFNPYAPVYVIKNPTRMINSNVNRPGLNGYRNGMYNNNNRFNTGSTLRRVFTPNTYSNRNSDTYTPSQRSYSPERSYSPSSGGSSSGGSGSSGGVSRPPRR